MKFIKKYKSYIIAVLVVVSVLFIIVRWSENQTEYHESRYELEEIEKGVYANYYQTHSAVPAQNYEVAEICVDGNIFTYRGSINISYIDEQPYAIVKKNNLVNDDEVYLYIPKGTLQRLSSVQISGGRR